jgi:hypothetical protein
VNGHGFVLYDVETGYFKFVETPNGKSGYLKYGIDNLDAIDNNEERLLNA